MTPTLSPPHRGLGILLLCATLAACQAKAPSGIRPTPTRTPTGQPPALRPSPTPFPADAPFVRPTGPAATLSAGAIADMKASGSVVWALGLRWRWPGKGTGQTDGDTEKRDDQPVDWAVLQHPDEATEAIALKEVPQGQAAPKLEPIPSGLGVAHWVTPTEGPGFALLRLPEALPQPYDPVPHPWVRFKGERAAVQALLDSMVADRSPRAWMEGLMATLEEHALFGSPAMWAEARSRLVNGDYLGAEGLDFARAGAFELQGTLQLLGDTHTLFATPEEARDAYLGQGEGTGLDWEGDDRTEDPLDLVVSAVVKGSSAERAGLKPGDRFRLPQVVVAKNAMVVRVERPGGSSEDLVLQPQKGSIDEAPEGRMLPEGVAYFSLPGRLQQADLEGYIQRNQATVQGLLAQQPKAFILDLRHNTGGTGRSMGKGITKLLGEGRLWGQRYPHKATMFWDQLVGGDFVEEAPDRGGPQAPPALPTAILIGPRTASAGEAWALAFQGVPGCRSFGSPTSGNATLPYPFFSWEGDHLNLSMGEMTNRQGQVPERYRVVPDEMASTDHARFGQADDPAVAKAIAWLKQQPVAYRW